MSARHLDDHIISDWEYNRLRQTHPKIGLALNTKPRFSHRYRLPYLAGISQDGQMVYIDKDLPEKIHFKLASNMPVWYADPEDPNPKEGYRLLEPRKFLRIHEVVEWVMVVKYGRTYENAHHIANTAERQSVENHGLDWSLYNSAYEPFLSKDELADFKGVDEPPPDLALYPYGSNSAFRAYLKRQIVNHAVDGDPRDPRKLPTED
jgi:hypothetical protein